MDRYAEIRQLLAELNDKARKLPNKKYESKAEKILRVVIGSELVDACRDMDILIGGTNEPDTYEQQ